MADARRHQRFRGRRRQHAHVPRTCRRFDRRTHGIKAIGCTLTPYDNAIYYRGDMETYREAVNMFIRTGGAFDAFVDFEAATRDAANRRNFAPNWIPAIIFAPERCRVSGNGGRHDSRSSKSLARRNNPWWPPAVLPPVFFRLYGIFASGQFTYLMRCRHVYVICKLPSLP